MLKGETRNHEHRDRKEDKAMTNDNDARKAHKILDDLFNRKPVLDEEREFLRNALPELPKQKTLEEIIEHVLDAWAVTSRNDWGVNSSIEDWLGELHTQLKGLKDAPAHPEFLETEADYQNAPEGTIVACEDSPPWHKFDSTWLSTITHGRNDAKDMTGVIREVLRWGDGE